MARNLLIRTRKRAKIVPIESIVDLQDALVDDLPDPETVAADRHALAKLIALLPDLPERCRRILEMRKFDGLRSEEHTSELQSLMRISYAVFCLKKKKKLQT